jgi:L-alanine-DL-glutamate epimerase-like enolase superfamily enzyme
MGTDRLIHEMWEMEIPLPRAFGTPAGPFQRVFAVALRLNAQDGHGGVAYAQMSSFGLMRRTAGIMSALLDERGGEMDRLIQIERLDSGVAGDQAGRAAICAISMAAWDLLGQRLGKPCAALWGGEGHRTALDAYASAFFSDATIAELEEEARAARERGFRKAKMRLGLSGQQDEARYAALCDLFPEPRSIALEAHFKFSPERTEQFMATCQREPMWIEEQGSRRCGRGLHIALRAAGAARSGDQPTDSRCRISRRAAAFSRSGANASGAGLRGRLAYFCP